MDANPTLMHDAELPEVMKNMTFFYIDSKVMIRWPKVLILALEMDPNGNTGVDSFVYTQMTLFFSCYSDF